MGTSDAKVSTTNSEQPRRQTLAGGSVLAERFTIWRCVGRGLRGEVYEALDRQRGERVALKTLSLPLSDDPGVERRLAEELRPARRIVHRHVCRLHELYEHRTHGASPLRLVAMEFVSGEPLAARIARGPLPPRTAARIARQLLEGLGAAHAGGALHLDFKSQNVMLRASLFRGDAVITDFNLSRAVEAGGDARAVGDSAGHLSPEQLEGRAVLGAASDLYSFGVVFFEMLTGRLPFPAERAKALMALRLAGPTPLPSRVLPGLTTGFDAFVAKCLARHPSYRYSDAESALAALALCRP